MPCKTGRCNEHIWAGNVVCFELSDLTVCVHRSSSFLISDQFSLNRASITESNVRVTHFHRSTNFPLACVPHGLSV